MASILNVDQINNAAGTSAVTIDASTGKASFPNGATLPAGSVIQVVQGVATATTVNTGTPTTVVQASITVSQGSKVFATACGDMNPASAGNWHTYRIYRDSTAISQRYIGQPANSSYNLPFSICFVETAGLNAGTYTYSLKVAQGVGLMSYGETGDVQAPTIVLMEIAQ